MVRQFDPVSPLEGEVEVAKLGVKLACDFGFQQVILEGDFETVMKATQKWPQPVDWRIGSTVKEIHDACCHLLSMRAVHVYRGANEMAHHLARWIVTKYSLVGNSCSCEFFLDLSWLYAGTDPP
ncbi:hypothetical protein CJ030_MR4G001645 [Morella rubra]|uniref:RNase H type-1 domain-containing protein n=1 Tax=Morella rubra TaxID=262757 RepID=A0A6A1VSE6_9ROSI|nr:hypothetical protein CJ030_MR4G001645 [Morella rubra]